MPEDDVGSLGRAIVVYEYIRQKCRFDLKSEGKKKNKQTKKNLAHMVSLIVFERSGGGKKKTWLMSLIVFERCGGGTKKKTKQKKPLRRDGWVVHIKRKGVSPERSGGHQFCHFFSVH